MKKLILLASLIVFAAGCGGTPVDPFDSVSEGMTRAEVVALIGEGKELPNLDGDDRALVFYDREDGSSFAVAYLADEVVGAKPMP